eukprot:CAMPEP_0168314314 /NCGR_PEP_ID=MMETSP0210-20121227/7132_1 /TAXON_ID=40633 /ORGANISM="Condylostoma magnum, Strain COL2" /LENGTH=39 /DNA_ID= /DNA_START= /DNA_END= /DNA_ORIENTATION=
MKAHYNNLHHRKTQYDNPGQNYKDAPYHGKLLWSALVFL